MTQTIRTIGLIGAGNIGTAVARRAVAAGYDVLVSNSRGPETLTDLVADLGPRARAVTREEAAEVGEVVVVTIPLHAYRDVPAAPLAGKPVLDTLNYYPERDGRIAELDAGEATTSGLLQAHLADAHVVKAFNTIWSEAIEPLARPTDAEDRSALPIYGDDGAAKALVTELLDDLGYDAYDGGGLDESWRVENGQPAYGTAYSDGDDITAVRPAGRETIERLVAAAERSGPTHG